MRRLSLLLLACLTLGIAWAERVSVNTAQQVAANVAAGLSPSNLRSSSDLKLVYAAPAKQQSGLRSAGNESDYYIFNVGTGDGFIIVAGEDRVRPVLGYSAEGEVDMEKMPENMKGWLAGYQEEISWVAKQNISASDAIQKEWQEWLSGSKSMANQGVLLETAKWGQGEPYNRMTPILDGEHAVTGCVATAQSIVMYYYRDYLQKPFVTSTTNTYSTTEYTAVPTGNPNEYELNGEPVIKTESIQYNGYNWDNMLPEYIAGDYSDEQAEAVAELMRYCGLNAEMNYTVTYFPDETKKYSSGATTAKISSSLKNVFGFAPSVRYVVKDNYSWDEWEKLISQELYASRPVILNGTDPRQGGHAFVCDGYKPDGMVHINWGWNGFHNDAYFLLTTLDDDGDGNGFAASGYGAIIGIHPTEGEAVEVAPPYISIMQYEGGFPLSEKGTVNIAYRLTNLNEQAIDYYVALAIVDENNLDNIPTPTTRQVHFSFDANQSSYYSDASSTININVPLADNQRVSFVYSTDGENWKLLPSAVNLPIGLKENGEIYEEEEEELTSTVEWLSNPYDGQYMQLVEPFFGKEPIQIKLNDWKDGETATVRMTLKEPIWKSYVHISYNLEQSSIDMNELVFDENGIATIQVPSNMIKDGLINIYMNWSSNAQSLPSEVFEYELSVIDATPVSPIYKMTVLETTFVWKSTPGNLNGSAGDEFSFTFEATNVRPEWIGKTTRLSFYIPGMSYDEVEIDYINEKGIRVPLKVIPYTLEGYDNISITEDCIVEPLVENRKYHFILRCISSDSDCLGQIYPYSLFVDDILIPDKFTEGVFFDILQPVIVSGETDYIPDHTERNIIIESTGIYAVNEKDASVNKLIIEDGGQVAIEQPLKVNELEIQRKVPTDKWTTFAVPAFGEYNWLVTDDMQYDRVDLFANGTLSARHGYKNSKKQYWSEFKESEMVAGTAILIANAGSESTEVFVNKTSPATLTAPYEASSNVPNGNWFQFIANINWENLQIQGRAYVLDETGLNFVLRENPIIKPFEAYMVASDEVMANVSNLRIGDIPTSNEDLAVTGFRVWTESGHVCFETTEAKDVAVYSMNGVQQCSFERSVGMHRQQLPQGIYIVVCDGTAYKVSVK